MRAFAMLGPSLNPTLLPSGCRASVKPIVGVILGKSMNDAGDQVGFSESGGGPSSW